MGLQKDVECDNSGLVLSYWHLAGRQDHMDARRIDVTLYGYVSEAAYKAGKLSPAAPLHYSLLPADFPQGADFHAIDTAMLYRAVVAKAEAAAMLPRDGNPARLPEVNGMPTNPALCGARELGNG